MNCVIASAATRSRANGTSLALDGFACRLAMTVFLLQRKWIRL
jgi:hypothetical protein